MGGGKNIHPIWKKFIKETLSFLQTENTVCR